MHLVPTEIWISSQSHQNCLDKVTNDLHFAKCASLLSVLVLPIPAFDPGDLFLHQKHSSPHFWNNTLSWFFSTALITHSHSPVLSSSHSFHVRMSRKWHGYVQKIFWWRKNQSSKFFLQVKGNVEGCSEQAMGRRAGPSWGTGKSRSPEAHHCCSPVRLYWKHYFGVNMMKAHYVHAGKYHKEPPLYT